MMQHPADAAVHIPPLCAPGGLRPPVPVAGGRGLGQGWGPACGRAQVRLVLVVAPKTCPPWSWARAPGPTGHPGGTSSPRGSLTGRHDGVGIWGIKQHPHVHSTHRRSKYAAGRHFLEPSEGHRPSEGTLAKRVSKVHWPKTNIWLAPNAQGTVLPFRLAPAETPRAGGKAGTPALSPGAGSVPAGFGVWFCSSLLGTVNRSNVGEPWVPPRVTRA